MRPFLLVPLLPFLVPAAADAQCRLADVTAYDFCVPNNPITLTTAFPFEYPVFGSSVQIVSPDAPADHFKLLIASGSGGIVPLGPPAVGCLLLANPFAASPLQTVADWTFPVPAELWDSSPDAFVQCLSTDGAEVLLSNGLELYLGYYAAEIELLGVSPIGTPVSGDPSHPYSVTFRNNGNAPATPIIQVCVGGLCGSAPFPIAAGETLTATVSAPVPAVPFSCGGGQTLQLGACSLLPDCDPSNDCFLASTFVASAYWDLAFEIINEPSSVHVGQTASWQVRVTNKGNIPSDNVCFINGIVKDSGAGIWSPAICFNTPDAWTTSIAPGASKTFSFFQFICSGAAIEQQWIKTEIHYFPAGCFDNCAAGNFDQESIQILP